MLKLRSTAAAAGLSLLFASSLVSNSVASTLDKASANTQAAHAQGKASQQKIDEMHQQTTISYEEYSAIQRQANMVEAYNSQLEKLVHSQLQEIEGVEQQIQSLEQTEQAVLPMLHRMTEMLEKFVAADQPFLVEERKQRLERLNQLLLRADVSLAEKYRQILEAYMIEVDYGRSLEAYNGTLAGEVDREVTYLRLGRSALYYQTLDGRESGLWQPEQQQWQSLPSNNNAVIKKAIRLAWQQTVPELLELPLPALER